MHFLRLVASLCVVMFSVLGIAVTHAANSTSTRDLSVTPGDIIVKQETSGWSAIKILVVDRWPDGSSAAHCLVYKSVPPKPTIESLKQAEVLVWHAPIAASSFQDGWEEIGNEIPRKDEFVGFVEYLKLTDFPRYINFTGQDAKTVVRKANEHYSKAYALGDQGRRLEAVAEYAKAIALFPLFYEAIDNRALTYMELGRLREALNDFQRSLRVNPNGVTAFFSKGECLLKLGDLKAAEAIFQEGLHRFPGQRAMFIRFLEQARALQESH